jgi:hypothetical protein
VEAHRVVRRRGSHIFLGNRLTDDGEVVSLTRRPAALYPQVDSWYSSDVQMKTVAKQPPTHTQQSAASGNPSIDSPLFAVRQDEN